MPFRSRSMGELHSGRSDPIAVSAARPAGLMNLYDEDSAAKRDLLYRWLGETDYIVITSNRLYDSITRLPMRYPLTTRYYELLFAGKLGFELVHEETSFPSLFGITFDDRSAEEAWSVYDHPVVLIFQKTPAYTEALVRCSAGPR